MDVGCSQGRLGEALKRIDTTREVFGVERETSAAAQAATRLDGVFVVDVEKELPPLDPGSLDCIIFGDVLEHLVSPGEVLRRYKSLLNDQGIVLCSVPNIQHHSILTALLKSDFQYTTSGLLDSTHLRFFTYSTLIKLLLDAGYVPEIVDITVAPCSDALLAAAKPLLSYTGANPERTRKYLDAYQYILKGVPLKHRTAKSNDVHSNLGEVPISFVVCVSSEEILEANLLSSPCLREGSIHEILLMRDCSSAAEGLNRGLERAVNEIVVFLHQDVYLPDGWPQRFVQQYRLAQTKVGQIGVIGVYGVLRNRSDLVWVGHVVDRDKLLCYGADFPTRADAVDEVLFALPKTSPLRFDPSLGFHFYGADICQTAKLLGLPVLVIDALCFHNSLSFIESGEEFLNEDRAFYASAIGFGRKWIKSLPLATTCLVVDESLIHRRWITRMIFGNAGYTGSSPPAFKLQQFWAKPFPKGFYWYVRNYVSDLRVAFARRKSKRLFRAMIQRVCYSFAHLTRSAR